MNHKFSAMILAAGFGKRMLSLTKNKPKPLIKVNNITLLGNTINFLKKLGCDDMIINTHYKHSMILEFINQNYSSYNIKISYEKNILDTGGGIKKAIPLFQNKKILITNSDVFWHEKNFFDVKKIIENFDMSEKCKLLLVKKNNSYGLMKNDGDFKIKNKILYRWKYKDPIIFYTGLQLINSSIFENIIDKKFSINRVWDSLIENECLLGQLMTSDWYHVGDSEGIKIANNLYT